MVCIHAQSLAEEAPHSVHGKVETESNSTTSLPVARVRTQLCVERCNAFRDF